MNLVSLLCTLALAQEPIAAPPPPPPPELTAEQKLAAREQEDLRAGKIFPIQSRVEIIEADYSFPTSLQALETWSIRLDQIQLNGDYNAQVSLTPNIPSSKYGLTFTLSNLPPGMTFDPETRVITWTPPLKAIGVHTFDVTVSNGTTASARTYSMEVLEEWTSFLMPGLGYVYYQPEFGTYQGVALEYVFFDLARQNQNPGPSHGRLRGNLELLHGEDSSDKMLLYGLGMDLNLERNPKRRYLMPWFGLEIARLSHIDQGSYAMVVPNGGLYLWTSPNLTVTTEASYVLPLNYDDHSAYAGLRAKAAVNFAFW